VVSSRAIGAMGCGGLQARRFVGRPASHGGINADRSRGGWLPTRPCSRSSASRRPSNVTTGSASPPKAIAAAGVAWSARANVPERARCRTKAVRRARPRRGARARRRGGDRGAARASGRRRQRDQPGCRWERLPRDRQARGWLRLEQLMGGPGSWGHADAHRAGFARLLRRNASGFRSQRPIGSLLLLGPTGRGQDGDGEGDRRVPSFHSPARP